MKWTRIFAALVLISCTKHSTSPVEPEGPLVGWRSAGLISPGEGKDSTGFEWMRVSGDRLYVLNALGQVFEGRDGGADWRRLLLPDSSIAECIQTTDTTLLIGTLNTGRVWVHDLRKSTWDTLAIRIKSAPIRAIGVFASGIVIYASWQDSGQGIIMLDRSNRQSSWGEGYPVQLSSPHTFLSWGNTLFAATYENGLWKRGLHDSVWTETVRPLDTETGNRVKMPRGLAIHRDSLWMGQLAGNIYRTKDGSSWTEVDNCPITEPCFDAPYSAFALLSYRDRLFAAGQGSASPVEWDPDSSKWVPILNETWCRTVNGKSECGGTYTWDLAAIGDTLYACGNARIMKMPLSDLPKRGRWGP